MAVMGKNSSSIVGGVMFFMLVCTLLGGANALGTLDDYLDNVDNYIHDVDNTIHDTLYPNQSGLMQWGMGVFIAIIVGIIVSVILVCVCCGCMCYHCCCKTSPPPYTTLVVAGNQPTPMVQPVNAVQMNVQQQAAFGQQQPYAIKNY